MPAVIQPRCSRGANIVAAIAPRPTKKIATTGRSRQASRAATANALPQDENIKPLLGPATSVIHSHSTAIAATAQNNAKGQPPT